MKRLFTEDLDIEKFKKDTFNVLRVFPRTHMLIVHVTKNNIEIIPAASRAMSEGCDDKSVFDFEKAALYKMLVGIDNLRLLGDDIALYLGIMPVEKYLFYMTIDGKKSDRKQRYLFCKSFGFEDAILQYGITGKELLDSYLTLPDVPLAVKHPGEDTLYAFNLKDLYKMRYPERQKTVKEFDRLFFDNLVCDFLDSLNRL